MGNVARAIITPLSIIDKDLARVALQVAVVVFTLTGHPELAALAGLVLATLYRPKAPKPPTAEGAVKTSLPPRVSAYGRSRLYGAYICFETAENGTAVDVFAVHDGEMDGPEGLYLGDELITQTGTVVNEGDDKRYQNNSVNIYYTLGSATGTAFAAIVSLLPGVWTNNHRGDGVVLLATTWKSVKAKNFSETYPQGQPVPASMAARWQKVFDWRDPAQDVSDPTTWEWSENACLHLAHYKLVREKARRDPADILPSADALQDAWDVFFAPTIDYWTAAADDCDLAVPLKAGGTEPRYRSCVAHKHTDENKDVVSNITAAFDGFVSPRSDGALVVYSGRYYEPTVSIGPDEIVAYSWQEGVNDEDAINEIPVSYVSAAHDYNTVEADPWMDLDDISERGRIRSDPLENQVPSHGQARRLAKRLQRRMMAPHRGSVTTNRAGRVVRGERYINLLVEEAGAVFYDGPAEITEMVRNAETGGVTFSWIAADPDIDDWNAATEEGEPAAVGDRVAQIALTAPEITSAIFFGTNNSGSGIPGARIRVTISAPDREDLTWFARWRTEGATTWGGDLEFSDVDPGASVVLETDFVPSDAAVEIQVAYQVGDGRVSPWSVTAIVETGSVTFDSDEITFDDTDITFDRG